MTMPSPIEVEAHEFSVADLKGLSQDNIMNDYDNRQLAEASAFRIATTIKISENKADIDVSTMRFAEKRHDAIPPLQHSSSVIVERFR
jgi:hypothetical protein